MIKFRKGTIAEEILLLVPFIFLVFKELFFLHKYRQFFP